MYKARARERLALALLLLLAFLPRAVYPVSRPLQWYFRSSEFLGAVLHGDWMSTLISEHPGVTVMWLSGAAVWGRYGLLSLVGLHPPGPLETEGYAFADRVAVGVLPLALVTALGIAWSWHLLRRLFDERVSWVATGLWALDPFHLANSKVLHLDATLSTLMVVSALHMLVYLQDRKRRDLTLSAVVGGLALLTKVTALFLVPFLGLCLLSEQLSLVLNRRSAPHRWWSSICDFLIWVLVAGVVCSALWPSLWVQPRATLDVVVGEGILRKMESAHGLPRFHRGTVDVGDPGPLLYVDTLLFRTTFLSLPFSLLAVGVAVSQRRQRKVLLLACFAAFYVVQMSLGSRKEPRYLLPAIVVLDLLGAWGIVWWSGRMGRTRAVRLGLSALLPLVQAGLVLSQHPYYGTHYNALLGGARAAARVLPLAQFGEGLDLAGQYIKRQSGAEEPVVGTQFLANEMVDQYVRYPVHDIANTEDNADYLVFGIQYTVRGQDFARWGALWERVYKFREPAYVATFDAIPYAWVHAPRTAPIIPEETDIRLGEDIRLAGYRVADRTMSPGEVLLLTLYWQSVAPTEKSYSVFTHVQDSEGELVAQRDGLPSGGEQPTSDWEVGAVIEDTYEIPISPETRYGAYTLSTGMYDTTTMARLTASNADGKRFPQDRIPLATVEVEPVVPRWRWALTGVWLSVIAIGTLESVRTPRPPRFEDAGCLGKTG